MRKIVQTVYCGPAFLCYADVETVLGQHIALML